jgi:drug/metabolite transporter (DMT)-like permease
MEAARKKLVFAHVALWAVALLYGGNYLIGKGLMGTVVGPSGFIVLRAWVGGALFWLVLWISGKSVRIAREDWGRIFLCGATGVAANQLLFFNGLHLTTPVHASVVMTVNPVLVLGLSALMLGTTITRRKMLGIAAGAAGAIALLLHGTTHEGLYTSWQGDAMVFVNALSYGLYLVLVKPLLSKYQPLLVVAWVFAVGAVLVLPFGAAQVGRVDWSTLDAGEWAGLAYVVIGVTFFAYLLNMVAIRQVQPAVVSMYIYMQPVIATVLTMTVASWGGVDYTADLSWWTAACAAAIFAGVWWVSTPGQYVGTD